MLFFRALGVQMAMTVAAKLAIAGGDGGLSGLVVVARRYRSVRLLRDGRSDHHAQRTACITTIAAEVMLHRTVTSRHDQD